MFAPPQPAPLDPEKAAMLELAREAAAGDGRATAQLLRAVAPLVTRVVRAVLGGGHPDVADVVQQSLIGLVRALPAFRGDCAPEGYAQTIAMRTALLARRRTRVDRSRRDDDSETDAAPCPNETPEQDALTTRRRALLRELLAELPVEQAEALGLRIVLGWSLDEVATAAGAPLNTIRSRLRLAKEALRRRIEAAPDLLAALEVGA
ncbi:MAG: RNA polymerase sigma factor [Myxococcales bacterium]|jgi:RNA polymerase sigma-70 factor (ECF subfamily)|nr:RNA polymerase sigma factor [Myxococcales bacterium]